MEFRGQKRDHPSYSSTQKPETGERIPKHSRILLPMDIWIANIYVPLSTLTKKWTSIHMGRKETTSI